MQQSRGDSLHLLMGKAEFSSKTLQCWKMFFLSSDGSFKKRNNLYCIQLISKPKWNLKPKKVRGQLKLWKTLLLGLDTNHNDLLCLTCEREKLKGSSKLHWAERKYLLSGGILIQLDVLSSLWRCWKEYHKKTLIWSKLLSKAVLWRRIFFIASKSLKKWDILSNEHMNERCYSDTNDLKKYLEISVQALECFHQFSLIVDGISTGKGLVNS